MKEAFFLAPPLNDVPFARKEVFFLAPPLNDVPFARKEVFFFPKLGVNCVGGGPELVLVLAFAVKNEGFVFLRGAILEKLGCGLTLLVVVVVDGVKDDLNFNFLGNSSVAAPVF